HLSFDNYHAKADRTFRLVTELHFDGVSHTPGVPNPMGNALRTDFSQLERVAMIKGIPNALVSVPNAAGSGAARKFKEEETVAFAEPQFFDVFDYRWVKGDPKTALSAPNSAVLTRKQAAKYFGRADPIGRVVRLDNQTDFKVTGILDDIPENTDHRHGVFLSYSTLKAYLPDGSQLDNWGGINSDTRCFVVLPPHFTKAQLAGLLPGFTKKYNGEDARAYHYQVQPLADIHFNGDYNGYVSKPLIWSLALVGLFLVGTACINFVNLATAQALKRSKEVGIRKVVGSTQAQLFWQFIGETALVTALSVGGAVVFTRLALSFVNEWFESNLAFDPLRDPQLLIFLPLLTLLVIFLAGFYPALVLSGFQPVVALKGRVSARHVGSISLRRGLIVAQFAISQVLIIGTLVVTTQMDYAKQADLGFNRDALLMMPVPVQDKTKMETMRNRMLQVPGVEKISLHYTAPASGSNNTSNLRYDTRTKDEVFYINTKPADRHYLDTYGLKLVAGRNLVQSDT
ncbi:MAG: ABC transporter permease, partial [Ferruginibacter sp.]|nr:ABC transporter permease [Cytophagales bacterium]